MRILRCCACLALLLAWHAPTLHGQASPPPVSHRPALRWQTVRTEHFDVHHPAELAAWAQAVAARVEAARAALVPHVGHAPGRTHVVVDEVGHVTGGFAWAVTFDLPLVLLWPAQQMPVLGLTQLRPDVLATHEIAHIAHLGRPSRSRWGRVWPRLVPPSWDLSPILLGSPGWVVEGYATYTEGRITGAGTPFSVLRAALLRQWALDGRLPGYGELNGGTGFLGSRIPYGVGSAYFEWLEERAGDEAIRRLWTRMAAADRPAFAAAFTEVFGARPEELYTRFAADVTARAVEARDSLAAAGLVVLALARGAGYAVPGVALVLNVDGFGTAANKISKYDLFASQPPRTHRGFKLFYREDEGLMTPREVMKLRPRPELVVYE